MAQLPKGGDLIRFGGYEIPQYMGVASHLLPGQYEFFPPLDHQPTNRHLDQGRMD